MIKYTGIIAQYEDRTAKLKADVPQLEAIISKSCGKEDESKQLKSDFAALNRKITATLAPKKKEQDGEQSSWINGHNNLNKSMIMHNPPAQRSRWLQSLP